MKLWVDDVREMPKDFDVWAKTYEEAIKYLQTGEVTKISLDHDLGTEKTGYDIAKFIRLSARYYKKFKRFDWIVHSKNPVGAMNIITALVDAEYYWDYWEKKNDLSKS